jgi:tyrosinase
MAQSTYAITGIPLVPGQPLPTRKEVTAWYTNDENDLQVSLFMQALTAFKAIKVIDEKSYFRVAGIHGQPVVPWDGVTDPAGYYCAHQLPTFPTWHRPYMALYEQRLYEEMLKIIDNIPADQKGQWQLAASQWRLPYWDWAAPQPYINDYGVPEIFTTDTISIVLPGSHGKKVPYSNPLWKFSNPSGDKMGNPSMKDLAITADGPFPVCEPVIYSRRCS